MQATRKMRRGRTSSCNKSIVAALRRSALIAIFAEHSTPHSRRTIISSSNDRVPSRSSSGDRNEAS
jgi:hypothetical protein